MKVTRPGASKAAAVLLGRRDRYRSVALGTGVPVAMIAVIHDRESSGRFNTYLGNGEPLNRVTRLVPRGRGPFKTWEEGAIDAIKYEGLDKVKDWRLEKMLYWLEDYNGWGYFWRTKPSAYLWAGSDQYEMGKFINDGSYDADFVDPQWGCAPLLAEMAKLNKAMREGEAFMRES